MTKLFSENRNIREGGRVARRLAKENVVKAAESIAATNVARRERAAENAAEIKARNEATDNFGGIGSPRTAKKVDAVKLRKFTYLVVPGEAVLGEEIEALGKIAKIRPIQSDAVACMRASVDTLIKSIDKKLFAGNRLEADVAKCYFQTGFECEATDIAGVVYGGKTELLVKTDAPVMNYVRFNRKVLEAAYGVAAEGVVDNITKKLVELITVNGISVCGVDYTAWGASAGMQKQGKCWFGEADMMERTADVRHAKVELSNLGRGKGTNGSEELKLQALLFTPCASINLEVGKVAVIESIYFKTFVKRMVEVSDDGTAKMLDDVFVTHKRYDGFMALLKDVPSFQGRGFGFKMLAVNISSILAMVDGWQDIVIQTIDGPARAGDFDAICTVDCWKADKLYKRYGDFVEALDELSGAYPFIRNLRVVRYVDSAEERSRHTSRQLVQQFIDASDEVIDEATKRDIKWLKANKMITSIVANAAGFEKPAEERTAVEVLYGLAPHIWASAPYKAVAHEKWERRLADASCGTFQIDGQYPYITEDPFAFVQIVFFGMATDDPRLGALDAGEINVFDVGHMEEVAFVRFPANFLVAQALRNNNIPNDLYASLGNILVINVKDETMLIQDADVDGDEGLATRVKWVINAIKEMMGLFNGGRPVVSFNHSSSSEKLIVNDECQLRYMMAQALWRSQKYNKVGENSNLSAACLHMASVAAKAGDLRTMRHWLTKGVYGHVGAILAIDMVKTGKVPEGLMAKLAGIKVETKGKMPDNQRYNKHNHKLPYWDSHWSKDNLFAPSNATVDAMGERVRHAVGCWSLDTQGMVFDVDSLCCRDAIAFAPVGRIDAEYEDLLGLYSFNAREAIQPNENGEYSPKKLMLWFWQNACALAYKLQNDDDCDKRSAAEQYRAMQKVCRAAMLSLDTTRVEKWVAMDAWHREKAIVNQFIRDAFERQVTSDGTPKYHDNTVGKDAVNDWERDHLKGSYARFVVEVFATDILDNVETNLGITGDDKWVESVDSDSVWEEGDLDF